MRRLAAVNAHTFFFADTGIDGDAADRGLGLVLDLLLCHWDGSPETEQKIKDETQATIRCIPVDSCVCEEEGKCIYSGQPSHRRVVFAISY